MVLATKERIIADRQFATERYILSTLPVLYLPLHKLDSGSSGGSFISADGHGYLCEVTGALLSQGGRLFDGDDVITHTALDWQGSDSFGSILVWFKTNNSAAIQILFASADTGSTARFLDFRTKITTGELEMSQENGDTEDVLTASTDVTDDAWHLGAVVSSGTAYSIYLDGLDEGALTVTGGANNGDWFADTSSRNNFTIGALTYTSTILHFDGTINEVLVYNRALTPQEIQNIYIATSWRYK